MRKFIILVLMTALLSVGAVMAQDVDGQGNSNDPTENEDANACFDGGTLEGRCDSEVLWVAGWYLIRFEYGLIERDNFPNWLIWVLPPEITPEEVPEVADEVAPAVPPAISCYTNGSRSFELTGALNTSYNINDNGRLRGETTCTGPNVGDYVLVTGTDQSDATSNCLGALPPDYLMTSIQRAVDSGFNTPTNWWLCAIEWDPLA